jgi:hypothetical protein
MEALKKSMSKKSSVHSVPESLDGKVGHEDILDQFNYIYESLYNSAGTQEAMNEIKVRLQGLVNTSSFREVEKITGKVVKDACAKMKPGKTDVSEGYTSDIFLHAPDSLFDQLADIFRSFLVHGNMTIQILSCAFLPLFKGGVKNPDKSDSYRAIAGASQLLKLFEYVILMVWGHLLGSDSMQFGFKAKTSTTQCSWLVTEVASYFLKRGTAVNACLLDCSKAFDKCRFDLLFEKLLQRGVHGVVVRCLIYMYEEQTGYVKLAGKKSSTFQITNGTRQGSVMSPALFSVYLDDLIQELRTLGLGCHIGGWWMGACGYADDLILLAPVRSVLQAMVKVCQQYGEKHNLIFSTDPSPAKSKTKCLYFCGRLNNVVYPSPVQLDGKDLPWVVTADHLGHTLHQLVTMDQDARIKRAKFIDKSVEIREQLHCAHPDHILKAMQVYCCDGYGSMLWSLGSDAAESFFKAWNTAVKLVYNVPRSTFTYLVEGFFARGHMTLRNQVLSRYPGFVQNLLHSPSKEVRLLANIVARNPQSNTFKNIKYIEHLTDKSPWDYSGLVIRKKLPVQQIPDGDKWRIGLITKMLDMRGQRHLCVEDSTKISAWLDSLCST